MLGTALRLIAAAGAARRLGDYLRSQITRYLVLSAAGIVFAAAALFALLAGFWALDLWTHNPVWAALIMAGSLCLAGFSIALTAYGPTRAKPQTARPPAEAPLQGAQSELPTVEDVGQQIEAAAHRYGPIPVVAAAAAGGLAAGLLIRRLTETRVYEPPRGRRGRRR
jgi:membrane associated rhomboid family serine protease